MTENRHKPAMRGGIRRTGAKSWELRIELPRGADGARRTRYRAFRGTRREAEKERARLISEVAGGIVADPKRATVADQLNRWLDGYARLNVSPVTCDGYACYIRRHLIPGLGHIQLRNLGKHQIESFYADACKTLSRQTVHHIHRVLHQAVAHAVPSLLPRNPVADVTPPRPEDTEVEALDQGQIVALLDAAEGTRLYAPIMLAATTGMRRGEVLGLAWRYVDLDGAVLRVEQALEQSSQGLRIKPPKTRRSRRTITLPGIAVEALRRHKGEQARERLALGLGRPDMVFTTPLGELVKPRTFSTDFVRLAKRAGTPTHFHVLRHSHATALLKSGEMINLVSARLGHSSPVVTLSVYAHVLPGWQEETAAKIDALFRDALGSPRKRK